MKAVSLSFLAALGAGILLAACDSGEPIVIEGGTRIAKHEVPTGDGPKGTKFGEEAPEPIGPTSASQKVAGRVPSGFTPQALDPSLLSGFDPRQAAGLRRDPGQLARGSIEGLVTFDELSLVGEPIDDLLDYLFADDPEDSDYEFPERIRKHEGPDKAIVGYMIALAYESGPGGVSEFMLVKDLESCCFGGTPRPDEWIDVRMKDGATVEYVQYLPVVVRGALEVARVDEDGYAAGVYSLAGTSAERFTPPPPEEDE